jgi:hypothetical protein
MSEADKTVAQPSSNQRMALEAWWCRTRWPNPADWESGLRDPNWADQIEWAWKVWQAAQSAVETADSERLDWVLRNVSGAEWRRLGVVYSGDMTREALDGQRAPDPITAADAHAYATQHGIGILEAKRALESGAVKASDDHSP